LFLHQINLGEIEDFRNLFPVHILWRGVIEILCGNDERRKKYSMPRAGKPYGKNYVRAGVNKHMHMHHLSPSLEALPASVGDR
jgi:hypothetical protein